MSVNCQFFGKICIRVTPADQFNNRIRGWVYWGLFLGRSVRWKNWGKIERGEMGANGRRGLRGRREMQLNIDQNIPVIRFANHLLYFYLNEADQMLSWNVIWNKMLVCFLIPAFCEWAFTFLFAFYLWPVQIEVVGITWCLCLIGWLGFVRVVPGPGPGASCAPLTQMISCPPAWPIIWK